MELLAAKALEPFHTEFDSRIHELDIRSFPQRIIDDGFVLIDSDGTSRVDDVAAGRRGRVA